MPRPLLRRVRNRIAAVRQARGLTQAELALLIGASRAAVAAWELDLNFPSGAMVGKMAQALRCRPSDLYPKEFV